MRSIRTPLPAVAAAAVFFAAFDAHAGLEPQLDRVVTLAKSDKLENLEFTKRQVSFTMRLNKTDVHIVYPVRGKQERKQVRYANLRAQLGGDRQVVYETLGWPTYRMLEDFGGARTERWTYVESGVTFVFGGDTLLRSEGF